MENLSQFLLMQADEACLYIHVWVTLQCSPKPLHVIFSLSPDEASLYVVLCECIGQRPCVKLLLL